MMIVHTCDIKGRVTFRLSNANQIIFVEYIIASRITFVLSSFSHLLQPKRHLPYPFPCQIKNRITQGRCKSRQARLPYPTRFLIVLHNMHFYLRDLINPRHRVIMKIRFHRFTILKMSSMVYCCTQRHDNTPFHLGTNNIRIYIPTTIYQYKHFVNPDLSVRPAGYFHHLSYHAAKTFCDSNSPSVVLRF